MFDSDSEFFPSRLTSWQNSAENFNVLLFQLSTMMPFLLDTINTRGLKVLLLFEPTKEVFM
jgi:hypothetical protein